MFVFEFIEHAVCTQVDFNVQLKSVFQFFAIVLCMVPGNGCLLSNQAKRCHQPQGGAGVSLTIQLVPSGLFSPIWDQVMGAFALTQLFHSNFCIISEPFLG